MSTIITALAVIGFIGLIIGIMMIVHERDRKRDALKKLNAPGNSGSE